MKVKLLKFKYQFYNPGHRFEGLFRLIWINLKHHHFNIFVITNIKSMLF
jgi:hypothetical protein